MCFRTLTIVKAVVLIFLKLSVEVLSFRTLTFVKAVVLMETLVLDAWYSFRTLTFVKAVVHSLSKIENEFYVSEP